MKRLKEFQNSLIWAYLTMIAVVFPLYYGNGYGNIGNEKLLFFKTISLVFALAYIIVKIMIFIKNALMSENAGGNIFNGIGAIPLCLLLFLTAIILSSLLSPYSEYVLKGSSEWGMGGWTYILLVAVSISIAVDWRYDDKIWYLLSLSTIIPIVLAILNSYNIDLLSLKEGHIAYEIDIFISTIGNYGWFWGYIATLMPIGIGYLIFGNKNEKIYFGIYTFLVLWCFLRVRTDSFYISAVITAIIYIISLTMIAKDKHLAAKAGKDMECEVDKNHLIYKKVIFVSAVLLMVGFLFLSFIWFTGQISNGWGNGRGYIWKLSLLMFKEFDIKGKLFGIGSDCMIYGLNDFLINDMEQLVLYGENIGAVALTNAHNEYLNYAITIGMIGLFSYICLLAIPFKEMFIRFIRSGNYKFILCGACIASYAGYNILNYSQICSTPFLFILIGVGGALVKNEREKHSPKQTK